MRRQSVSKQICYWVLALALFAVRSADAHVHMCLDGQEAHTALHVADSRVHHDDSDVEQVHSDKDVKYSGIGVFKKGASADLWILSNFRSVGACISSYTDEPSPYASTASHLSSRSRLHPPLRGPPR